MESFLDTLPNEILHQTMLEMDGESVLRFCQVSTKAMNLCDPYMSFWREKYQHDFPNERPLNLSQNPKDTYILRLRNLARINSRKSIGISQA